MKKGITQKEIARRLGISQALVSRALTGTSEAIDASPLTVERIRKAAVEWNYSPNAAALTLKGAPTKTIGVIVKSFEDPFFGHMIGVLQGLARKWQYALLLVGWEEGSSTLADEMILHKYQPDALIVCGSDYCPPAVRSFLAGGKPVVQIGVGKVLRGVRQVALDEEAGMKELIGCLRKRGHERIGYVGGDSVPQLRREELFRAILKSQSAIVHPEWIVRISEVSPHAVKKGVSGLLACRLNLPTALVAADDDMAQQVMRVLHDHGVRVPEDISLTGFDDIPAARMMIPSLTSVRQPVEAMVNQAFQWIVGKSEAVEGAVVVAPSLIVRESCGPVSDGKGERS